MGAQEDSLDLVRIDPAGLEICSFSVLLSSKPDDTEITLLLKAKKIAVFLAVVASWIKTSTIYSLQETHNQQPSSQRTSNRPMQA